MQKFTEVQVMDTSIPNRRQAQIIVWLQENDTLTIKELVARLNVSAMTIHRDLDKLAAAGLVQKVHGGVKLAPEESLQGQTAVSLPCVMCGTAVSSRTAFTITLDNDHKETACCAHCGILRLSQLDGVGSALTPDFIYGRMVNVFQAWFLVGSDVQLCCVPGILSFARANDAQKFQQGFHGEVMDFTAVQQYLIQTHMH